MADSLEAAEAEATTNATWNTGRFSPARGRVASIVGRLVSVTISLRSVSGSLDVTFDQGSEQGRRIR